MDLLAWFRQMFWVCILSSGHATYGGIKYVQLMSLSLTHTFVLWLYLTDVLDAHVRIDNSHTTPRASVHVSTVNE